MNTPEDRNEDATPPVLYTEEQEECVSEHIENYFGESTLVIPEEESPWVMIGVHIIPPAPGCEMYTLVTQGAGARSFRDEEGNSCRCELLVNLPPSWAGRAEDWEKPSFSWPVALMRRIARLPFATGAPIGLWHSFDLPEDLMQASGTDFSAAVLLPPQAFPEGAESCPLEDLYGEAEESVTFLQVVPLFAEELRLLLREGREALLHRCTPDMLTLIDGRRLNAVTDAPLIAEERVHGEALRRCRSLTDFVSYCIAHDLLHSGYTDRHAEVEWALRTAVDEEQRDEGAEKGTADLSGLDSGPLQCWATVSALRPDGVVTEVYRDGVTPLNSGWDSGLNFLCAADEAAGEEGTRLRLTNLPRIAALHPELRDFFDMEPGDCYRLGDDGQFHLLAAEEEFSGF